MKKLLMTAATLLVLGNAPVLAGSTVPKDMLGSYCAIQSEGIGEENVLLLDDRKEEVKSCGDGILVIRADRYDGWEHTCRFTAIRPVFDRDLIATTKTMGVTRMQIDAICKGEGCTWKEQFSLYKEQGSPKFRKERHYQERCGKESAR
jgi:hypothetical protein